MRQSFWIVLAGLGLLLNAATPVGAQVTTQATFPPLGNDTLGPQFLITFNANGSITTSNGPGFSQGPYDGSDDTYFGVINNGTTSLSSFNLMATGPPSDIFHFDLDGVVNPGFLGGTTGPAAPGNPNDPTGYGGPGVTFSNYSGPLFNSGTVNFTPALPPGGSAYFALEEAVSLNQIVVNPPSGVPEPSSFVLAALGLGATLVYVRRRRVTVNPVV
jgi:hypothetical protein